MTKEEAKLKAKLLPELYKTEPKEDVKVYAKKSLKAVVITTELKGYLTLDELTSQIKGYYDAAAKELGVNITQVKFETSRNYSYFFTTRLETDEEYARRLDWKAESKARMVIRERNDKATERKRKLREIKRLEEKLKELKK